jgi:hypothetical protein
MRSSLCLITVFALVACDAGAVAPRDPDAPTDLVYQLVPSGDPASPLGVVLEWQPPSSGLALSYDVYGRSSETEEFGLRASTTSPSFHDAGLPQLQYFVQAVDEQGRQMGTSDTITIDERNRLPAPRGLVSVTLNGGVELEWDPNAFEADPDLFDYSRVYSSAWNATAGCAADYALEGTTVSDGFVARNLPNGETRCFAVSAISLDGHESILSNVREDTPRYDARNIVVDASDTRPATSGFVFASADTFGLVVSRTNAAADLEVRRGSNGALWFRSSRSGVRITTYGASPVSELTSIDRAPSSGYADSVRARAGYGYAVRLTDGTDVHYGAIRVLNVASDYVLFDFAYQSQAGNAELLRAKP